MDAPLKIRLFGTFHMVYGDEPPIDLPSAKMQALLAYLLVHRNRPHSRQVLAFLLWPESSDTQARTNLRREVHHLRRLLPSAERFLTVEPRSLQWRQDAPYQLDVADFESALNHLDAEDEGGDRATLSEIAKQAVDLYTGPLLPHFWDEWIIEERERFSQGYIRLLEWLITERERAGDYRNAISYCQRLLRHDPLQDRNHRLLIQLHAQAGDAASALRAYHSYVTVLRRELDVGPSPASEALYHQLMEGRLSPPLQPTEASGPSSREEFVGRGDEWQCVQQVWHTASQGAAHLLLVTGEAGIGKSRLVEELVAWVQAEGISTAAARCYAVQGRVPYAPVADWLRADIFRTSLMALEPASLSEVSRLLPELIELQPDLPPPQPLSDREKQLRLFRAMCRTITGEKRPLLLVIDDLQWCDQNTLEWLHYLLRFEPKAPLLVVATLRTDEADSTPALTQVTLDLGREAQITELLLGRLDADATCVIATQILDHPPNPEQARWLYENSEGIPLFIVEMVRAGLPAADRLQADNDLIPGAPSLPPKIRATLQYRLSQLSEQATELINIAAVVGRSFSFNIVAAVSELDEKRLVYGLDELWQRRLILEQGTDAYDFSHDKIREVAYAEISPIRRRLLHRNVAEAMVQAYASVPNRVSGQIALHYFQAGMILEAAQAFQLAAASAQSIGANEQAIALYTRAIEASHSADPPLDTELLIGLYEGRGLLHQSLPNHEEAVADFHSMRRLAQDGGKPVREGESLCHLAYTHWLTFSEDQIPLVEEYAQSVHKLFTQTENNHLQVRKLTLMGAVDQVHGDMVASGQKLQEALQIGRQHGYIEPLVLTYAFLCLQTYLQGDFANTVDLAQEGLILARQSGDSVSEMRILSFLCQGYWSTGAYSSAFSLLQEGLHQAEERGNKLIFGRLLNTQGWFHRDLGDTAGASEYNRQSIEIGRANGIANVELSALINLAFDHLARREYSLALTYLEPTLERVHMEGFGAHKWRWTMKLLLGLAEYAFGTGNYEQSLAYAEEGLQKARATSSSKFVVQGRLLQARALLHLGRENAAGRELQRAYTLAQSLQSPTLLYPCAFELGKWHESTGDIERAATLYRESRSTIDSISGAIEDAALRSYFLNSELPPLVKDS